MVIFERQKIHFFDAYFFGANPAVFPNLRSKNGFFLSQKGTSAVVLFA